MIAPHTLSVCLITRDEEALIAAALASVRGLADQIVVADTGSRDRTVAIARAHGAKVVFFPWCDDFAAARNAALLASTGAWVLLLDADERVVDGAAIRAAMEDPALDVGLLPLYDAATLDASVDDILAGGPPTLLPRLFRRAPDLLWEGLIHETPRAYMARRIDRTKIIRAPLIHFGEVSALRVERGKLERDVTLLRRRVAAEPANPVPWSYLANALHGAGELDDAWEAQQAAWQAFAAEQAATAPPRSVVRLATVRIKLQLGRERLDDALASFAQIEAWASHQPRIQAELGHPNLLVLRGCALELHADRCAGPERGGALLTAAGCFAQAVALHDAAFVAPVDRGFTGWFPQLRQAACLLALGDVPGATQLFEAVLAARPDELEPRLGLAECRLCQQRLDEAEALLAPVGDQPDAWVLRACLAPAGSAAQARAMDAVVASDCVAPHRARQLHALRDVAEVTDDFVFIGGAGRSGTTLLRAMLHAHPNLHAGPESKLVPAALATRERWWQTLGPALVDAGGDEALLDASVRALLRTWLRGVAPAGRRVVDKNPHNALHFGLLARLFPRARCIHLIRDGRAVASSLVRHPWLDTATGIPVPYCADLERATAYWVEMVQRGRFAAADAPGRVLEVRYEALVTDPAGTLRAVLDFLGEPWDAAVLHHTDSDVVLPLSESSSAAVAAPVHTRALNAWRTRLSDDEVALVEQIGGAQLRALSPPPPPQR